MNISIHANINCQGIKNTPDLHVHVDVNQSFSVHVGCHQLHWILIGRVTGDWESGCYSIQCHAQMAHHFPCVYVNTVMCISMYVHVHVNGCVHNTIQFF